MTESELELERKVLADYAPFWLIRKIRKRSSRQSNRMPMPSVKEGIFMLISVLYVGDDAPADWIDVDGRAFMAILPFEDFKVFVASHSGKIYACPEVDEGDMAAWETWREAHNGRIGQCQKWELG